LKYFLSFRIFEQFALALKHKVCPELTVLNIYLLSLRIFEQLALALKTEFALKIFKTVGGGSRPRTAVNLIPTPGSVVNQCSHGFIVSDVQAISKPA